MNWHLAEPVPAIVAHPVAASLDEAHAAIELWEYYSKKRLDGAQRLAVEHMMAEADDGLWAASSTGRAESRQNGKGDEIEVPELWGLTQRGEAILHTAHEAATAASAHVRLRELILGHRDLRAKLGRNSRGQEAIQSWNGNYRIEMADGSVIVHRTRTSAIGRGLDDISRLVVDEAQHAQPEELASATPILAANPNPQKNYIGSAAVKGRSEFWWRLRMQALYEDPGRFAWLEHSAELVSRSASGRWTFQMAGDVADRALWRRANPAFPARISDDFLDGQLRDLGPEHFAREHLCVWDPDASASGGDIDLERWAALEHTEGERPTPVALALNVTTDRAWSTIGLAGRRTDGATHVQVVQTGRGTGWVVDRLVELRERWGSPPIALNPAGPAGALIPALGDAGIEPVLVTGREVGQACGAFFDAIADSRLRHSGQPVLNIAVRAAGCQPKGESWVWRSNEPGTDIGPLDAVTLALAVLSKPGKPPRTGQVVGMR